MFGTSQLMSSLCVYHSVESVRQMHVTMRPCPPPNLSLSLVHLLSLSADGVQQGESQQVHGAGPAAAVGLGGRRLA